MPGNHVPRPIGLTMLLALAVAALSADRAHAGFLSFSVDLRTGVADRAPGPYITIKDPPVDANHDGWYEAVLRINLNDPKVSNPYHVAEVRVEYDAQPTGQVNLEIGNSPTNDSGGGDAGTQGNDAEIHIGNADGHGTDLFVFGRDGSSGLIKRVPGLVGKGVVVTFTVSNGRVSWKNDRGASGDLSSPDLFALAGQPDREGPVNYDIYAAFNRAIAGPRRFGTGVSRVTVTLRSSSAGASDVVVTTLDDRGPGSLRQAILDANAATGPQTISFAPGVTGTIQLASAAATEPRPQHRGPRREYPDGPA